jgi:hypothetical protein
MRTAVVSRMVIIVFLALLATVENLHAETFYVACDNGDDANAGVSELHAWKSASKVARFDFRNGDEILFKRGCVWEDVSIKITRSVELGAYGEAAALPQLIAAAHVRVWSKPDTRGIVYTFRAIEPGVPSIKEVLIVYDAQHNRFYEKVRALESLDTAGKFFHDIASNRLHVFPLEGADLRQDMLISSKPHVLEFQPVNIDRVVVDGLHLSFANEYAIGFWYQSSGTRNGSIRIVNCIFSGNAYQAIHIGGTNTFRDVDILNNTITANGNEGIYIGYVKGSEEGEVVTGTLRISGNTIGGLGFGWRSEGLGSAANGEGIDIKKGVVAAVIDHNTVFDLTGMYGIGVQSSNAIVEQNTIRNIHMRDAQPDSGIAGIVVDPNESKGPTVVRGNRVDVRSANGIAIRGHGDRKPRFEIYDNEISVEEPYFPFAFTSQNVTNTVIRNNRTRGGRAGLWVQKACCPPANVEFHDNDARDVSAPFLAAQNVSAGVRMYENVFCVKGAVDTVQRNAIPQNTFSSDCGSSNSLGPSQQLQVR